MREPGTISAAASGKAAVLARTVRARAGGAGLGVGNEHEGEVGHVAVEASVGEGQLLRVGLRHLHCGRAVSVQ